MSKAGDPQLLRTAPPSGKDSLTRCKLQNDSYMIIANPCNVWLCQCKRAEKTSLEKSVVDIFYTSTVLPKLLAMLYTQRNTIYFLGCIIQMNFVLSFISIEYFLLVLMAYDRYVAICRPLHYILLLSPMNCARHVVAIWIVGLLDMIPHSVLIANLSFCSSHHIDHFFCDVPPLLKLSCSDTTHIEIWTYIEGSFFGITSFLLIVISYMFIISSILNINSTHGRQKAFSTCASHLTSIIIFCGTMICLYIRPSSEYSPKDKFFSLIYLILIPLLNPLIYTLKNKDFKDVLRRL
ncbi:olfactory receptor 1G1-like [Pelodytes ibericus]